MRAFGQVAQVHGIPPFSARVVQSRTVRLINGVALDECPRSGALPDARTIFEPLNAKKLERPAALDEPGIVYTPQRSGILTWWSHVLVKSAGVSWWKRPTRGSKTFNQRHEWIPFWKNIGPTVWTKFAHSITGKCPREGTTSYRAAKAVETSLRPAIRVRTSSTKRGRTMNCATVQHSRKRSGPILGFGGSFAGFISSRTGHSSELYATGPGRASLTVELGRFVHGPFPSP